MLKVNNFDLEWTEGLTVQKLLEQLKEDNNFKYLINSTTTVMINRVVIPREDYPQQLIKDEDIIMVYPQLAGG